jgi:hypothetical protein
MYHQQALAFIKENHGKALTKETLETYSSYLTCENAWDHLTSADCYSRYKYISPATRIAVLRELVNRTGGYATPNLSERTILGLQSPIFFGVPELVKSTDIGVRGATCTLLGALSESGPSNGNDTNVNDPCMWLVVLLRRVPPP